MKPSTPATKPQHRVSLGIDHPATRTLALDTFSHVAADLMFAVLEDVVVVAHEHQRHTETAGARLLDGREHIVQRDPLTHTNLVCPLDRRAISLRLRVRNAELLQQVVNEQLFRQTHRLVRTSMMLAPPRSSASKISTVSAFSLYPQAVNVMKAALPAALACSNVSAMVILSRHDPQSSGQSLSSSNPMASLHSASCRSVSMHRSLFLLVPAHCLRSCVCPNESPIIVAAVALFHWLKLISTQ